MPLPPKVLKKGITDMVRISDARMSGTAYGTVVLHTAPEAADGGPLAAVRSGDFIELDVPNRRLHLDISDAELAERMKAWRRPQPPLGGRLLAALRRSRPAGRPRRRPRLPRRPARRVRPARQPLKHFVRRTFTRAAKDDSGDGGCLTAGAGRFRLGSARRSGDDPRRPKTQGDSDAFEDSKRWTHPCRGVGDRVGRERSRHP